MKKLWLVAAASCVLSGVRSQTYFPPLTGNTWETTDPATLGWCQDSINRLYDFLEANSSKAFIVLKNGKIVLERYFGSFTADSLWVWNSAGKTLTAFAVGIAQQEGHLSISDTTSNYLGTGWTNMTPQQEQAITIRHQLTMTTGIADTGDVYCTDPACLNYLADPGDRWAYHNGPYTLLDGVIENATGMTLNQWVTQKICLPTGMSGSYVPIGYNHIFVSKARTMARFGLLMLNEGNWNGMAILNDPDYFHDMTHSSQNLNPSYGYLTWLSGQNSFMVPGSQISFPFPLMPQTPSDMYSALGKNGQIINVSPSRGLVVVRMGTMENSDMVPIQLADSMWYYIDHLECGLGISTPQTAEFSIFPNPATNGFVHIQGIQETDSVEVHTLQGQEIRGAITNGLIPVTNLSSGIYLVTINRSGRLYTIRLVVN